MPIKFKCAKCAQELTVKDELAGRTGKCPACKATMTVPALKTALKPAAQARSAAAAARTRPIPAPKEVEEVAEVIDEEEDVAPVRKKPVQGKPAPVRKGKVVVEDEDEVEEDVVEEVEEEPTPKKGSKSSKAKKHQVEDEDDDDRDEDEDDSRNKKKKKKGKFNVKRDSDSAGMIPLGIGAAVLLLLGVTVFFNYFYVSVKISPELKKLAEAFGGKGKAEIEQPDTAMIKNWRGVTILVVSLVVAVGVGGTMVVVMTGKDPELCDNLTGGVTALGAGWAAAVFFWYVGFLLWWVVQVRPENGAEFFGVTISVYPSAGMILGLLISLIVMKALYFAAQARNRVLWILGGIGIGAAAGAILILTDVQPWEKNSNLNFYESRPKTNFGSGPGPL